MYFHKTELQTVTALWLLAVVATVVASGSGGIVAEVLPNPEHALITLITSYVLWGTGIPLALMILVIYFQRLTIHHLPPREIIVSVFIPLGPLGEGGFAIIQLGKVAMDILPKTGSVMAAKTAAGDVIYVTSFLLGLIMWGFGLVWLFLAFASISRSKFPFNIGWWGFTFPLGVFASATTTLAKEIPSRFFAVLGTIFSVVVVILWMIVATETMRRALTGELFYAPCLKELEKKELELKKYFQEESETV